MAVPEGATKLGTVGIAYKDVYNELETYKYANAVYYNGSTYIALIDNPAGFPSNDGVNWRYLAQGFMQQAISALTVIDESGILGEVDAEVNAQEFLSKIAELEQGLEDTKANKADILGTLEEIVANTEGGRIAGANAVSELNSNFVNCLKKSDLLASISTNTANPYNLGASIKNYRYIYIKVTADGNTDTLFIQSSLCSNSEKHCYRCWGNDSYYVEGHIKFNSDTTVTVTQDVVKGWTGNPGAVVIYGIN